MNSLAAFRSDTQSNDLARLAEQHIQHDLNEEDRQALKKASGKVSKYASIGTFVGLAAGVAAAFRLRRARADFLGAIRAAEKPTQVVFADGRTESIPDVSPLLKPNKWADFATVFFFGLGGVFLGGETGFLSGTWSATRLITADVQRRNRIEEAYRRFRVDYLKGEIKNLEAGHGLFT